MLIEFSVENYRSFQEKQTFSMVASEDKSMLDSNTFPMPNTDKLRLLKSAVVYGANASGKSNLLRAIQVLRNIVVNSASRMQKGDKFPVEVFRLSSELQEQPSSFAVIFIHKDIRYEYGLALNKERVYEEWLIAFPNQRQQNWFYRKYISYDLATEPDERYEWSFGRGLKGEKERIKKLVRSNSLFLSHAAQNNHPQLTEIFDWFQDKINVISLDSTSRGMTLRMCQQDQKLLSLVSELIRKADIGILDIKIKNKSIPDGLKSLIKELVKQDTRIQDIPEEIDIDDLESLDAITLHRMIDSDNLIEFEIDDESTGTKRLFELSGFWLYVILHGELLIIDELERSLHPILAKFLIKMLHDANINQKHAQLIFATHDTTLLDANIFRRDQIWFTEKYESATKLYSLYDFQPREDESLQKGYLLGRYGAIPFISGLNVIKNDEKKSS